MLSVVLPPKLDSCTCPLIEPRTDSAASPANVTLPPKGPAMPRPAPLATEALPENRLASPVSQVLPPRA